MPKLDLEVQLAGKDGNIFNLMGLVSKSMKRNGYRDRVEEFVNDVTSSKSYDEALQTIMKWVHVH